MPDLIVLSTKWSEGTPFVRIRASGATSSELVPAIGLRLNYRAAQSSPRWCLGHKPFRKPTSFHDCLKQPAPSSRRCERCQIVEATFASNLHHAHTRGRSELDPSVLEHLAQPNDLYLAAFRDGSIKVGTSTRARRQERLEEQGAWIARVAAATTDGFAVRDLEDRVTEELGLPQAISIGRKLAGMIDPIPDDVIIDRLRAHGERVAALIETMSDSRIDATDSPWTNPVADDPSVTKLYRYPLRLGSGNHDLEIVGMVGRVAAARRPASADVFAIDLQDLFGIELETGDFESDEIAIQDSLF